MIIKYNIFGAYKQLAKKDDIPGMYVQMLKCDTIRPWMKVCYLSLSSDFKE